MDKNLIRNYINKHQNTGVFQLNLSNADDRNFYQDMLNLAGISSNLYPNYFQILESSANQPNLAHPMSFAQSSDMMYPVHSISALDSVDGINYDTSAITSLPIPATNVTQTLGLFDENTENIGDVVYNKNYQSAANCMINANGTYKYDPNKVDKAITVIYTFSQTINGETVYAAEIVTTASYPKNINNIAPKDINGNSEIKICLSRTATDCDYSHDAARYGFVSVPIQGNIEYFGNIDTSGGQVTDGLCNIYLIRKRQGGSPINPLDELKFFSNPNTKVDGCNISWDLDWLNFKKVDFNSGEQVYYVFQVIVNIEGRPIVSYITNASKDVVPDQRLLNTWKIKPMQIVYGCLGKNSMILMKDRSTKAIQDIKHDDWVVSQDNKLLRVDDVITGKESEYLIIHMEHPNGLQDKIITSCGHPFCTQDGILLAKELNTNTRLISLDGFTKILKIEKKTDEIDVYNLHLSTDDPGKDLSDDNSTMFANGVLVGDHVMQKHFETIYDNRPINVLDNLPEEWRDDYLNFINVQQSK